MDDRLEWDRDGQYFHYLTKWMHALDQTSRAAGEPRLNLWARELAAVAHRAFCHGPPGQRRMFWKMSTDLTRPLVPSMGQHDPLDGLVTCAELGVTSARLKFRTEGPDMRPLEDDFAGMVEPHALVTPDSLGIGGLLTNAFRVSQLGARSSLRADSVDGLLAAALEGLEIGVAQREVTWPASRRLGFRELGLAIGLRALPSFQAHHDRSVLGSPDEATPILVSALAAFVPLADAIEGFWLDPSNRRGLTWTEHRDINEVMLATCLAPEGFLVLATGG